MNTQTIINILINGGIEPNEAKAETEILLRHLFNFDAKKQALGENLSTEQWQIIIEKAKTRIKTRKPIQQITGFADFMGKKFIVNKNVLIPRDETEFLVREAVRIINENELKSALEIGSGSGCIACMVAYLTNCKIVGVDISNEALYTALDNATALNLFNKAIFRKSDIYSNVRENEYFDIIISNPPYIPASQKGFLQKELDFEPDIALFAPDKDGISFYEKIIIDAKKHLNPKGFIAFEIGINQAELIEQLLTENNFTNITTIKDLANIERVISARLN